MKQTISFNGTIVTFEATSTCEVEEDCTLTLQFAAESADTQVTATSVIVERGIEIRIIETDRNTLVTGTLKKVE
jgi:hypothetical protein